MADERSITLVERWRQGDQQAAAELFRRYAERLVALARSRLSRKESQRVDPEDIVQSVYRSFFTDTREGRYELQRGGDLWRLLVTITLHKVQNQVQRLKTKKRAVAREQAFASEDSLMMLQSHLAAQEPSPLEAVLLADQVEQLMRGLEAVERRMLEMRLQGHSIDEIAAAVRCGERTVRRALTEIKQRLQTWQAGEAGS
jgi:RNA polymerase sigma factor (sigma-70 family)